MSIWYCKRRKTLTGPMPCCRECEYATFTPPAPMPETAQTFAATPSDDPPLNISNTAPLTP